MRGVATVDGGSISTWSSSTSGSESPAPVPWSMPAESRVWGLGFRVRVLGSEV